MPMIFYTQKKPFNDITSFIKLTIKIMFYKRIYLVGNTNGAALHLKKISNLSRTKKLIAKNGFAVEIYFAQKFNGTLRIVNLSAAQQYSDELKIFSDEHMNFGVLAAA